MNGFNKNNIDPQALDIIRILQSQNYTTYLVGGCIRDILLGYKPKDFDIATSALPKDIKALIPQSYIIGKRFKLILVRRRNALFEVSTFRKEGGLHKDLNDNALAFQKKINYNVFGTPKEDAFRRDFTLNSIFYDPFKEGLIDYCNGLKHIKERTIHMIGNPKIRLKEDPIRILRAIRFSYKLDFVLEESLRQAIPKSVGELVHSSIHRRREEFIKILRLNDPSLPFIEANNFHVLSVIAPILKGAFNHAESHLAKVLKSFHDFKIDKDNPLELFSSFILSITRECFQESPEAPLKEKKLIRMMRDELGLFRYEQEFIIRALKMLKDLKNKKAYESNKEKLNIILQNNAFPIALFMAQRDQSLPPEVSSFWYEMYIKRK